MAFKKNQCVSVEINDITDLGFGVGRVDGAVVFVSDTVPGDVCEVKLIKVNKTYLVGRVEKYIKRSDKRVSDRCTERACKSCAYKNISYACEASFKEDGVGHIFGTSALGGITTAPVTPSPCATRYRNKAQYPIALVDGEYRVGFFAPKSHRVTPIADCPLTPSVFSDICAELCQYFRSRCKGENARHSHERGADDREGYRRACWQSLIERTERNEPRRDHSARFVSYCFNTESR